jgi:Holliday junction resolvase RusA-like endonuclease
VVSDDDIALILPLPPSINKAWVPVRTRTGAKLIKRANSKAWANAARWEVSIQRAHKQIAAPFEAIIELPKMRGDVDNRVKQLLDACQAGGAITNDRLCQRLVVEHDVDREGAVYLTLRPIK